MQRGGLWPLWGQEVQHSSGSGSQASDIHMWFDVANIEAKTRCQEIFKVAFGN